MLKFEYFRHQFGIRLMQGYLEEITIEDSYICRVIITKPMASIIIEIGLCRDILPIKLLIDRQF